VYFLIKNKEVVYIGSSVVDVLERVNHHFSKLVFDSYSYIDMKNENAGKIRKLEEFYIKTLIPKYNIHKIYTKNLFRKELKKFLFSYNWIVIDRACKIIKKEKAKSIFKNKTFTGISDTIISFDNIEKIWPEIKVDQDKYSYEECQKLMAYIQYTINKAICQLKSEEE